MGEKTENGAYLAFEDSSSQGSDLQISDLFKLKHESPYVSGPLNQPLGFVLFCFLNDC